MVWRVFLCLLIHELKKAIINNIEKVALVTGGNRGIGKEIVRQLAQSGMKVILSARFAVKGKIVAETLKAEGLDVTFIQLDVSDERTIEIAADEIKERFGKLDVLINNAGILIDGKDNLLEIESSKIFSTIHTNAIGSLLVTRIMLPLIPKGGRVVMISSGGGSICNGISGWSPIYCTSKTTLNALTMHLTPLLLEKGICINAVCPGWVQTDMGGSSASRTVDIGAETPVWLATEASPELTGKFFRDKEEISW